MALMTTKQFINTVLIHQYGELTISHPYIAFIVMGTGIEFLGKCINTGITNWQEGNSRRCFEDAINALPALQKYTPYIYVHNNFDLYGGLRCGLAHAALPKYAIEISSKGEKDHLKFSPDGKRVNLACEDFYADFKAACEDVVARTYPPGDKMNLPFLEVPDLPSQKETDKANTSSTPIKLTVTS